ncbi:hypothetical protein Tco_0889723, partial [Tanacetum coccineum]
MLHPPTELADAAKIKLPVQAHFGERDNVVGFLDITLRGPDDLFCCQWKTRKYTAKKEVRRQIDEDSNGTKVSTTTVGKRRPELPR